MHEVVVESLKDYSSCSSGDHKRSAEDELVSLKQKIRNTKETGAVDDAQKKRLEDRKQRKRESNRRSAQRKRIREKILIDSLTEQLTDETEKNKQLSLEFTQLKTLTDVLKAKKAKKDASRASSAKLLQLLGGGPVPALPPMGLGSPTNEQTLKLLVQMEQLRELQAAAAVQRALQQPKQFPLINPGEHLRAPMSFSNNPSVEKVGQIPLQQQQLLYALLSQEGLASK